MRAHTRHAVEVPVTIAEPGGHAGRGHAHVLFDTRDLSAGGAFLLSPSLLEIGEELTLEFALGGGRTVQARCRVVRVEGGAAPGMGIVFVGLADEDRAALRAFVRAHGG